MRQSYDVGMVGGAVIGSAVAYFLAANPDFTGSVLVAPTIAAAATVLIVASVFLLAVSALVSRRKL
ncbi:hypothetical protein [Mesorhizobium amorphae]|uniref:hypothetical protein n=1 Tax=Mesorhizobium amorphae TaxID=71433 RepID=UPI000B746056|nr:hypothetical protein [Mesorhizobium amorphae]OWK20709.1 hypothetical protein AJ88_27175 [Mesorhizobium amorphae CCBAU 01583]